MQTGLPHPYDFPPARPPSAEEVYQHLAANRFTAARHAVLKWSPNSEVRQLIEAGRHQDALCRLECQVRQPDAPVLPLLRKKARAA